MTDDRIEGDWVRGVLPLCVLGVVAQGQLHGYAVVAALRAAGIGPLRGGAVYPVLHELESEGALRSAWQDGTAGPGRTVFELTDVGRTRLHDLAPSWADAVDAVGRIVRPTREGS